MVSSKRLDEIPHALLRTKIDVLQCDAFRIDRVGLNGPAGFFQIPAGHDDVPAAIGQRFAGIQADAGGCTGHDDGGLFSILHNSPG